MHLSRSENSNKNLIPKKKSVQPSFFSGLGSSIETDLDRSLGTFFLEPKNDPVRLSDFSSILEVFGNPHGYRTSIELGSAKVALFWEVPSQITTGETLK